MEYEYTDESLINENLKCSICNDPFEQPVTTRCDHTFCYKCIEQWIKKKSSCPTCRHRIPNVKALIPVKTRLILNMLDGLLVKCNSCHQTDIQRGNFQDHFKICRKTNKCCCSASDIQCPWIGQYHQLSSHLEQCHYEQIRSILKKMFSENRQSEEEIAEIIQRHTKEEKSIDEKPRLVNQQLKSEIKRTSAFSSIVRTVTFESLLNEDQFGPIPNGFAGFNWTNARYTNGENARTIRSNQKKERIDLFLHDHSCVAYNDWRKPMIISAIKQKFALHACEIMSVNHSEEDSLLNIIARKDQMIMYSKTVALKRETSQVIQLNSWVDIDQMELYIENTYFILTWIQLEETYSQEI